MQTDYRSSLAAGGSDASSLVKDFGAWAFERRMRLDGTLPSWFQKQPTDAMEFGTAVHLAILEPARYSQNRFICPEGTSFATKLGKSIKSEFETRLGANPGVFMLKAEQAWAIEQICKNFEYEFESKFLVQNREAEVQFFDSVRDGWAIKGTADLLCREWLIDIKTTRDIHAIEQTFAAGRHNIQLAHYNYRFKKTRQAVIYIENIAPYRCRILELDDETIIASQTAWLMAMDEAISANLMVRGI